MATKELIKIDYEILRLKSLLETPGNPQKMTAEQQQGLTNSMKKDGWILDAPVVWHRPDGEYQIISGHHRVMSGIEAGILETGCKVIEGISEEKALLKVIEANQRRGVFDEKILDEYINNMTDNYNNDINDIYEKVGIDIFDDEAENKTIEEKQLEPYKKYHILISYTNSSLNEIQKILEQLYQIKGIEIEQSSN